LLSFAMFMFMPLISICRAQQQLKEKINKKKKKPSRIFKEDPFLFFKEDDPELQSLR
jgi:hypothetical protein